MTEINAPALLCVDIGNTTIGFCIYRNAEKSRPFITLKIPVLPIKTTAAYQRILASFISKNIKQANDIDSIISSVVPAATKAVAKAVKNICKKRPLVISSRLNTGLRFSIPDPSSTGADRISNAAAAFARYGSPCIVVDCGSATTLTVTGENGLYVGGAIMPGIETMLKALNAGTAKLKTRKLLAEVPALGPDTDSAISSGIIIGTTGAIRELVRQIRKETGLRFRIILTGGHALTIHHHLKLRQVLIPELTFEGLRSIYTRNR
ncbi:MAG: type III pantothenate kinase [Nitrospiraceae bacterium]|nr:type III pantothenate kinase [Nitrospiraceae bacterium]